MLYEDYLVETIFTPSEIDELRSAYTEGLSEYLSDLSNNPFAFDPRDEYVGDVVKEIFKERGVVVRPHDVTYLTNTIKYYMI